MESTIIALTDWQSFSRLLILAFFLGFFFVAGANIASAVIPFFTVKKMTYDNLDKQNSVDVKGDVD